MNDVMVDIETFGTEPGCVIVQLAAVRFDLASGEIGEVFDRKISVESAMDIGLTINADTLLWWFKRPKKVQDAVLLDNPEHIGLVLSDFYQWLSFDDIVWGNSARFDLGILEYAFHAAGHITPWMYNNERDVRTLVALAPEVKKDMEFVGTKHNALDDCKHQIRYCSEIWQKLTTEGTE